MIVHEENYFCFNLTIRRAAGLVGIATIILSVGLIVKASFQFVALQHGAKDPSLCKSVKKGLKSSCDQVIKSIRLISVMSLIDSTMIFLSSGLLVYAVIREQAWLLVPYMMWIKMTLSIHAVLCIFLATTYVMHEVSHLIFFNICLILVHSFCAHVVRHYDDVLMKKIFSRSDGIM